MRTNVFLIIPLCLCVTASGAGAAALTRSETLDLFNEGKAFFHEANDLAVKDPKVARELYRESVMRFERIVKEGEIENGKLYYNIGNAYFRMKDIGRAILNYRRAEQYIPNDPNLQQNLEYARSRRADRIDTPQKKRILKTLFFWHYDISSRTRAVIFAFCFATLWLSAAIRLFVRKSFLIRLVLIQGILSAMFLGSLLVEVAHRHRVRSGVVVAGEVVARKGDSKTYEPSFKEPLHAGTEFVLAEDRGEWRHIKLVDGRTCWVQSKAVELVR